MENEKMSKIFENVRLAVGFGLNEDEMYQRAFEKGVLMRDFPRAAQLFDDTAKRAAERGNSILVTRAAANALLYHYIATGDTNRLHPLLHTLSGLQEIECIGRQKEHMPTGPLCAELDCRLVEAAIIQSQDDVLRLRDLHKLASAKFQAILQQPLITYEHVRSGMGHDEKPTERQCYHSGMHQFYDAMLKKDRDPAAAVDDLALAAQAFRHCEDAIWAQKVATLLDNWRISRTCWLCQREVQGYELHFSMCRATITPYTQHLLESLNQDASTAYLEGMKVAICTPCGSMITFKAAEEAEKVRREMTIKFDMALSRIQILEERINKLQFRS
jgi:hypothetical protein